MNFFLSFRDTRLAKEPRLDCHVGHMSAPKNHAYCQNMTKYQETGPLVPGRALGLPARAHVGDAGRSFGARRPHRHHLRHNVVDGAPRLIAEDTDVILVVQGIAEGYLVLHDFTERNRGLGVWSCHELEVIQVRAIEPRRIVSPRRNLVHPAPQQPKAYAQVLSLFLLLLRRPSEAPVAQGCIRSIGWAEVHIVVDPAHGTDLAVPAVVQG
mmetsp:Transcript_56556/g.128231  ORF Transcript_56556/g.128231 Transcript_56556/m.128231 type:complete len:211 (+) Transcript_56556:325-957(+)